MFYQEAAGIIEAVYKKVGSAKTLALSCKWKNKKQMFAVVCETLKYTDILDQIIQTTNLTDTEKIFKNNVNLARVVLYEHLLGRGLDQKHKHITLPISRHKNALNTALVRIKIKSGAVNKEDLLSETINVAGQNLPRYVRVNTLMTSQEDVIQQFTTEGYKMIEYDLDNESFMTSLRCLSGKRMMKDFHINDLLIFPAGTDFHKHKLYLHGSIILQDKASCMPAYLLNPPPGAVLVDCCAAPGNKTSHAAALMRNTGKIFAFDFDRKRTETMRSLCQKAGTKCVDIHNCDFLKVDPGHVKYADVEYIIVDPSCSGSGIASRLNELTDDAQSGCDHRLDQLSKFQISVLSHALTFPKLRRLVYSTCSIHYRENEHVVQSILPRFPHFKLANILSKWPHRGLETFECGKMCIRANVHDNLTNGFFVAIFERKKDKKRKRSRNKGKNKQITTENLTAPNICDELNLIDDFSGQVDNETKTCDRLDTESAAVRESKFDSRTSSSPKKKKSRRKQTANIDDLSKRAEIESETCDNVNTNSAEINSNTSSSPSPKKNSRKRQKSGKVKDLNLKR